ncbi:MAG: hypothetical protein ACE5FD_05150 [Anaerolineae bacterium]
MNRKDLLPVLLVLLLAVISVSTAVFGQPTGQTTPQAYLPIVYKPLPTNMPTPTVAPTPTVPAGPTPGNNSGKLVNGSFENGWTTVAYGNQIPNGWTVTWLEPGDALYDGSNTVTGICECVHKLDWQLPPSQRPGGTDALILDGVAVYKVFSPQIFGLEMRQTVTGLAPGENWRLTVPIRVHLNGETDPWGAQTYVEVNGIGQWKNGFEMGDQQWYDHILDFTIPANGTIEVIIRFQNKWLGTKDFFIDNLRLEKLP